MTIATLQHFGPGQVPGLDGSGAGRAVWDSTANIDLLAVMNKLRHDCTSDRSGSGTSGWMYTGAGKSIGVFFWATNSQIDERCMAYEEFGKRHCYVAEMSRVRKKRKKRKRRKRRRATKGITRDSGKKPISSTCTMKEESEEGI